MECCNQIPFSSAIAS